jgi:hypothetical protein
MTVLDAGVEVLKLPRQTGKRLRWKGNEKCSKFCVGKVTVFNSAFCVLDTNES